MCCTDTLPAGAPARGRALTEGQQEKAARLLLAASRTEAMAIQRSLCSRRVLERSFGAGALRLVAGADAAYSQDTACAAVAVMTFPKLELVDTACAVFKTPFPYIPGLLAFREGPVVAEAFARLAAIPDLLVVNGHGYAHPERFGIACHLGVALGVPAIGVARRLMTGTAAVPGPDRGSTRPIVDHGEVIGMAVRTVAGAKPVFVSAGHLVDLALAVDLSLCLTRAHRMTEPLWQADRLAGQCRDKR